MNMLNIVKMRRLRDEKGQSIIEFGLIVPILLFFLLAVVEFGWILNAKITLTSAAREGARVAAVTTANRDQRAYDAVVESLSGVSGVNVPDDADHFQIYEVEDTVNDIRNVVIEVVGEVTPIIGLYVDDPVLMSSRAVMRLE